MANPNAPAFPRESPPTAFGTPGISTRTYLASRAMQGILAHEGIGEPGSIYRDTLAYRAVEMADRLIEALNKTTTEIAKKS